MAKNTSKQPDNGARAGSDAQDRSGRSSTAQSATPSKSGATGARAGAGSALTTREGSKASSSTSGNRTGGRETGSATRGRATDLDGKLRGPLPQGKGGKEGRANGNSGPGLSEEVVDFLCCGLETEQGGILVYNAAIDCAQNEELAEEWEKYLGETEEHVQLYTAVLEELGIDPKLQTPGRPICRNTAQGLLKNMQMAQKTGDLAAAEIVAAECVVIAESKCHLNWELVGELGKKMKSDEGKRLKAAYAEVHEQEKEHLYHTQGWARELWIARLGMPAVIPPPEEEKDVKTRIGAEKAKNARKQML